MTILNTETGELVELDQVAARRLTDKIKVGVEGVWLLIEQAYTSRAWQALGYKSWDTYTTREFGTSHLKLPREDRTEVIGSMRDAGLSIPAISVATGLGVGTVHRAITAGFPNGKPAPETSPADLGTAGVAESQDEVADSGRAEVTRPAITGTDGKSYPATQTHRARPSRPAETTLNLIESLADKAARETQKLTTDQIRRVKPNAAEWTGGIRRSVETLQGLLAALEQKD